jgi:hypothetical protein
MHLLSQKAVLGVIESKIVGDTIYGIHYLYSGYYEWLEI